MKIIVYTLILFLAFVSCAQQENNKDGLKLHKLDKLFVTGNFNGDGKKETLFQHNYSGLDGKEIDWSPDPFQHDWDTVSAWFYRQQSDVYLAFSKTGDTLHLGPAQGLYCLINIGDNNNDGKDEIALVVDYCDQSRVNSCKIYSLCNAKWTLLKEFGIFEGAFDWAGKKQPLFKDIKEFLEKDNGNWVYTDYNRQEYDTAEEVNKLKPLRLDKCTELTGNH